MLNQAPPIVPRYRNTELQATAFGVHSQCQKKQLPLAGVIFKLPPVSLTEVLDCRDNLK